MKKFALSLLLLSVLLATSCTQKGEKKELQYFTETGTRFHTIYHITYQNDVELTDAIDSIMTQFNNVLNVFDSTSVASRVNRNEADELHPMLKDVILQAQKVSEATDGVYDITGAPLFDIWGFGTKKGVTRLATKEEVDSILAFVGYQKLSIDTVANKVVKADPRVIINPSSVSKGYVTDLVARTLEEHGVINYMVEIGGEVAVNGVNPEGNCWRIGINKPIEDNTGTVNEIMYVLQMCDKKGMASSGDYRNFKMLDGRKVAHTLDVTTGYPAHQDILSATVLAPTSMEADAWATAFMALGMERSKKLLEQQPQLSVCLIYTNPETGLMESYEKGVQLEAVGTGE